jgi:hypothetical protein
LKQLHEEQKQRYTSEKELAELKNRPPPVTPRQQQQQQLAVPPAQQSSSRTPSPSKPHQIENHQVLIPNSEIYLPEYCRLTLKAVQKNPNVLVRYKEAAIKYFNEELDQLGIDPVNNNYNFLIL